MGGVFFVGGDRKFGVSGGGRLGLKFVFFGVGGVLMGVVFGVGGRFGLKFMVFGLVVVFGFKFVLLVLVILVGDVVINVLVIVVVMSVVWVFFNVVFFVVCVC